MVTPSNKSVKSYVDPESLIVTPVTPYEYKMQGENGNHFCFEWIEFLFFLYDAVIVPVIDVIFILS